MSEGCLPTFLVSSTLLGVVEVGTVGGFVLCRQTPPTHLA